MTHRPPEDGQPPTMTEGTPEATEGTAETAKAAQPDIHPAADDPHALISVNRVQKHFPIKQGVLFQRQDVGLAAAGVEQDSDRQGQVLLLCQPLDDLRIVVFGDLAVVFAKAGDEAVLVAHGEVDVDQVDVHLQRRGIGPHRPNVSSRCFADGRWRVGRGGVLGAEACSRPQERERQNRETAQRHGAHTPY